MRWPSSDAVLADQLEESGLRKPLGQMLSATGVWCGCSMELRALHWSRPHGPDCLMWRLAALLGVTERFVTVDHEAALGLDSTATRQRLALVPYRLGSHIRLGLLECGPWGQRQVDLCEQAWGRYVRSEAVRAAVAAGDNAIPGEALTAEDIETARRAGFPIDPDPMRYRYIAQVPTGSAVPIEELESSGWRLEYLGKFPTEEAHGETEAADLQSGREPAADRGGAGEPGPDGAVAGEGGEGVP